jgi:hypothetical protein
MDWAVCHTCRTKHPLHVEPDRQWPEFQEFAIRHPRHRLALLNEGIEEDPTGWRMYTPNANNKAAYGASTTITCTLASLASGSARCSAAVDNTTNLYFESWLYLAIQLATGTPAGSNVINVYGYISQDGTNYTGDSTSEVAGSDAAITLLSPTNMKLLGVISVPASATGGRTFKQAFSISTGLATPLWLPPKWGFVVDNETGLALGATEGNHQKTYSGAYSTSV